MKAMIFAAGLGTRLKPLTNNLPKALVEYKGKSLLQITIEKLIEVNISEVIINIHHFGDKVINFLKENKNFGLKIHISDEQNLLLDTGGGLKKAEIFFSDAPFLIHNVDIISTLNIKEFIKNHNQNNLATLAVQKRKSNKYLYFDENQYLCKWKDVKTGEEIISRDNTQKLIPLAFSGIHIINPEIFKFMQNGVYSIIKTYLELAKTHKITYFDHSNDEWSDMGKPECFI
jgi:NDP-sugar pyrophosphorylase family protein